MTGKKVAEIEREPLAHKPDRVLVYGDTNSTLAAAKLHIPVVHVEVGANELVGTDSARISVLLPPQPATLVEK
ncbi:UDP-N-acetylglucosamine 2-epimerase [Aeromonas cavernicola]|uniref:UDP-N-acetylglucosamine 2-epimerase n=1 Tax=Aeromonas cavernicola TaxID=1006623 RepID=UPI0023512F8F|nr:UDP-N-acetylglucosamine 2-epimerase [Aeromonas cavernicola]